jgi:hypothetical protein
VSLTASNYINLINTNYPVRGQDNDSQGFRDNFSNIYNALGTINNQVDFINNYAVIATNSTNTFYGNTILDVNLQNTSVTLLDNGIQTGFITVDYSLGSYQKITLGPGPNQIVIVNWPGAGTASHLVLSLSPAENEITLVNFYNNTTDPSNLITALGPSTNPYILGNDTNLFEFYSEYPISSGQNTVFVRLLNELIANNTGTIQQFANSYILNSLTGDAHNDLFFTISTATGSAGAATMEGFVSANPYGAVINNLAMVPNIATPTLLNPLPNNPTGTANILVVDSVYGVYPGGKFTLPHNQGIFTVTSVSVSTNEITCDPYFNLGGDLTGKLIIKNPGFNDYVGNPAFPSLVTLVNTPAINSSTGQIGRFAGSIYAEANHLEVTYADPSNNTNTFIVDTMPLPNPATYSQANRPGIYTITDTSTNLATAMFVHSLLPYGAIIMWYGNSTTVPTGWQICDGTNGTPDLRNQFIVGANSDWNGLPTGAPATIITGTSTSTGGQTNLSLPQHTHDLLNTDALGVPEHYHGIVDPGHDHLPVGLITTDNVSPGNDATGIMFWNAGGTAIPQLLEPSATGITSTTNVQLVIEGASALAVSSSTFAPDPIATGAVWATDVSYANIPPFKSVYYIMKMTGGGIFNTFNAVN